MWKPFRKPTPTRQRYTRRVTSESLDLTLRKVATDEVVRQLHSADEETKRQLVSQYTGITFAPRQEKSIDQLVEEALSSRPEYLEALVSARIKEVQERVDPAKDLAGTINEMALKKIKENPDIAGELITQRMADILNQGGSTDPFDKMTAAFESLERFKEKMGISQQEGFSGRASSLRPYLWCCRRCSAGDRHHQCCLRDIPP